jgi:hypothetical protein
MSIWNSGRNGKEEAGTGHANDRRGSLRVVEARALTTPLGHEADFYAGDFTICVGLDFIDPHDVDDHVVEGEINEFPRAIIHEGGVLMLHRSLPFLRLFGGEGNTVCLRLDAVSG